MSYDPDQVQDALRVLVENDGNLTNATKDLNESGLQIDRTTLRRWAKENDQTVRDLEREISDQLEKETISSLRRTAHKSAIELEQMVDRVAAVKWEREIPQAAKALADVQSKSVDKLMALTGRNVAEGAGLDMASLLAGMQEKGYLKVNVVLGPEPAVDGEAEVLPDAPRRLGTGQRDASE